MDTWDSSVDEDVGGSTQNTSIGADVRPASSVTSFRMNSAKPKFSNPLRSLTSASSSGSGSRSAFAEETLMEYIPDLEDVQEEDLTMTVAAAPEYKIQQIASLKELDAELLQSKPFSTVDGVSLRKLCKFLVPERFLAEDDDFWDWENTYTEIAAEFRQSSAVSTMPTAKDLASADNEKDRKK